MEPGLFEWHDSIAFPLSAIVYFILWYFIFLHPIVRILKRVGYSGWNVLWIFVPVVNIIALWRFAYRPWPAFERREISN